MKLLIDLSTFEKTHKGGKDEVAYNLLRGFSDLGYTKQIVCAALPELKEIIQCIDSNYKVITLKRIHYKGRIGNLLAPFTSDIWYGVKLRSICKKYKCDRILFSNKLSPYVKQPVKTFLLPHDIQYVRMAHEAHQLKLYTRAMTFLIKLNFHSCDQVIAISDFDKNEMIRYFPRYKNKIIRIYDPIKFKSITLNNERTYITALNIQHPHKNTLALVKAYARIASDIKENLVLVGCKSFVPEVEMEIKKIIKENHLNNRIQFTGFVSEEELGTIIANTRIFVNPSLFEGFGMASVEMMESKVPTIVADNSAQKEVTLGLCRYYEPATDDKALANVIQEELNNPISKEELNRIAEAIRTKYDYLNIAKQYWNTIMNDTGKYV